DLPAIPEPELQRLTLKAINDVVLSIEEPGPFDAERWSDVYMEIIRPLIRNMRDMRRYVAALNITVRDLAGEVSLVDILALEAIRLFTPDVFRELHKSVRALTELRSMYLGATDPPELRARIDTLLEAAPEESIDSIKAMITRLFPAAER